MDIDDEILALTGDSPVRSRRRHDGYYFYLHIFYYCYYYYLNSFISLNIKILNFNSKLYNSKY